MISIVLPVRAQNNPECFFQRLMLNIFETTTRDEREKLEILLKFDSCDQRKEEVFSFLEDNIRPQITSALGDSPYTWLKIPEENTGSGLLIKLFIYNRGEGRADIDRTLSYLGTCVHPNSKIFFNIADDYTFLRNGWVTEILDEYDKSDSEYIVFHSGAVIDDTTKYTATGDIRTDIPREFSRKILFDYEEVVTCKKPFRQSTLEYYNFSYAPICSTKLFHTISCQTYQPSIDVHFILLAASVLCKFGINIWNDKVRGFYKRGMGEEESLFSQEVRLDAHHGGSGYNLNEISGRIQNIRNPLYFRLVEQQAKNIFLNIKSEEVDGK